MSCIIKYILSCKFFIVDCGFPNKRQFLAPYRGIRYHLQEYSDSGCEPRNEKELFNLRHASLRNVVERIFSILKSRFLILKIVPPFPYATQAEVVLACAAVHNFLRKECRSDEFPVELDDESSLSPPLSVSEGDLDQDFQTQEQQRNIANEWRYNIALDMWRDAHNDNNVNEG